MSIKRPSPVSIRFSAKQRSALEERAQGRPLSEYIKNMLFEADISPVRIRGTLIRDRQLYAKGLGMLGQSHLSTRLEQIAEALASGSLPYSEDIRDEMRAAASSIQDLRNIFIKAIGLKPLDQKEQD